MKKKDHVLIKKSKDLLNFCEAMIELNPETSKFINLRDILKMLIKKNDTVLIGKFFAHWRKSKNSVETKNFLKKNGDWK